MEILGALLGVVVGAGLASIADWRRWKRERSVRWESERRLMYRRFSTVTLRMRQVQRTLAAVENGDLARDDVYDKRHLDRNFFLQLTDELAEVVTDINFVGSDKAKQTSWAALRALQAFLEAQPDDRASKLDAYYDKVRLWTEMAKSEFR